MDDLAKRISGNLQHPVNRFFGFELDSAMPGSVTLSLAHRPDFEHAPGWFQGSITTAIGEMSAALSGFTLVPPGWDSMTLEQSIHFLGPAKGERLIGVGNVIKGGKTISYCSSDIFVVRDGERHLCGRMTMTNRHAPPRA